MSSKAERYAGIRQGIEKADHKLAVILSICQPESREAVKKASIIKP